MRRRPVISLRVLFLRRMLWVLLPSLLVGGALFYLYAAKNIRESYDFNLLDDATDLVREVELQAGGHLRLDLPRAAHQMLTAKNGDKVIYAVWDAEQSVFSGVPELFSRLHKDSFIAYYTFKNISINNEDYRAILLQAHLGDYPFYVAVAQTTHGQDHILNNVLLGFLLLSASLIILAWVGVALGVKHSLEPIEQLRMAIARRAPQNFQPLPEHHAPEELQPIIHGVNELLSKLEKSVLGHRRFVVDAAHQLRTPLAILRSKLEVNISHPPQDIMSLMRELLATTERASRLVSQLLSLARIENTEVISPAFEPLDLSQLIRACAANFVIPAEQHQMDMEFSLEETWIKGNALLLEELVTNLMDNALKYAGKNTTLSISLRKLATQAELQVADNGVGVADGLVEKLGQAFFRGQQQSIAGCGLGLAIAKEIVLAHGGTIQFSRAGEQGGLRIKILFNLFER